MAEAELERLRDAVEGLTEDNAWYVSRLHRIEEAFEMLLVASEQPMRDQLRRGEWEDARAALGEEA